jgi:plastocyanin
MAPDRSYVKVGLDSASFSFVTSNATTTGDWSFILQMTDNVGAAANSTATTVLVNAALSVSVSPEFVTLDVGQSQVFTANVSGGASSHSYQWYLNGAAVSGATGASWAFTLYSAGSYTIYVKVTDSVGMQAASNTASAHAQISVQMKLQIKFIYGPYYTEYGIEYYIVVFLGARPIRVVSNYW